MGELLAAVGKLKAAKEAAVGSNGQLDTSDPGVSLPSMDMAPTPQLSAVYDGLGQSMGDSQAAPQSPGISLADLTGSQPPQQPVQQQAQPIDNPYTPDDNMRNPAANIGSQQDAPIEVVGDSWHPSHNPGWLGKTLDVLEMLRGRGTPFKDRKDRENIEDAYKGYQSNPEQAIKRIGQVDPKMAATMYAQLQQDRANQGLADQRHIAIRNEGSDRLANMTGYLLTQKNPEPIYEKMLPTFRDYLKNYGYSDEEAANMLPDKWDPDKIGSLRTSNLSVADQARIAEQATDNARIAGYQQQEINLGKQRIAIEMYNADTARQEANNRTALTQQGTMANRQALYKQVLGGAATIPWLYGGFVQGVFGRGSSGIPKPGIAYVSPDKSMAVKLNANGTWSVYDTSKGTNHAREIQRLGGVVAGAGSEDFND